LVTSIILTIATPVMFANSESALTVHLSDFRIFIDEEEEQVILTPIVTINNRAYLPLRDFRYFLGMDVTWCEEKRKIFLASPQKIEKIETGEFEMPSESEGVLSTGIRYAFDAKDFNLNDFREQNHLNVSVRNLDAKVIAETPTEAVELGQFYLHPLIRYRDPSLEASFHINVSYCSDTNNWVLERIFPNPMPGQLGILVINRLDGRMRTYYSFYGYDPYLRRDITVTASVVQFRIFVDGEERHFINPIVSINDTTKDMIYAPLREMAEALGMEVSWCEENREIRLINSQTPGKNGDKEFERPRATEGFLSNGVRYAFIDTEFSLNDFIERNFFTRARSIDTVLVAETPIEAAELGKYYLHPPLHGLAPYRLESFGINVRYCNDTDNWILQLFFPDGDPFLMVGVPGILAINRLDGTVVMHNSSGRLSYWEIEW